MELFVVVLVCLLAVAFWFALWIECKGVKGGIIIAILFPSFITALVGAVVYVVYCFSFVFSYQGVSSG